MKRTAAVNHWHSMLDDFDRKLRTIYQSLLASLAIYGGIGFIMLRAPGGSHSSVTAPYIFAGCVVGLLALIPTVNRRLLPRSSEATSMTPPTSTNEPVVRALGRLQVAHIVTWVLCETIALLGLYMTVATQPGYYLVCVALALWNFIAYRPRPDLTRSVARAAQE